MKRSQEATVEGTGRRAGLDRADVVLAALRLVETEGADALTMRNLAGRLEVTTTTIYWHVGGRDELITELIRYQSEIQAARPIEGETPHERVVSLARHIWESARENRAITSLAHQNGATSLLERPLEIALVHELQVAGVTGAAAAEAHRAILATVGGLLIQALRDESIIPANRRSEALWADTDPELGLDAATIDALAQPADLDALFESTINAVVAHILAKPEPVKRRSRPAAAKAAGPAKNKTKRARKSTTKRTTKSNG